MTATTTRNTLLREALFDRRHELQEDVRRRLRDGRTNRPTDIREELENSDANSSEDVGFTLLEMKTDTLRRIDEAIHRLGAGDYGNCLGCDGPISETRLKALPFAVRCRTCEEQREQSHTRKSERTDRQASLSLSTQR